MEAQYDRICDDLHKAGIRDGMVLMVHSSFRSIGFTAGSPALVIRALQEVLTERGTLLMPALTWATVTRENPVFSVRETPCCVGAIPEAFRQSAGVLRSVNPVHSVCAWGHYAEELTREHFRDESSLGEHSPYRLLPKYQGKILMLGCGLRPNTFMHAVENAACAPYRAPRWQVEYQITDMDGSTRLFHGTLPDMSAYEQRYDRVSRILSVPELQECDILEAHSYLIDSAALMEKGVETIRRFPFYFVDKRS